MANPKARKPPAAGETEGPSIVLRPIEAVLPYARNARTHSDAQVAAIAASIDEFGLVGALVVRDGTLAKGHGTLAAIRRLLAAGKAIHPAPGRKAGAKPYPDGRVPVLDVSGWSEAQFRAYVLADNALALQAGWDDDLLRVELDELAGLDVSLEELGLDQLLSGDADPPSAAGGVSAGSLSDRFMIPPFSVLNAREGWWQDRKRAWLALGIKSELGRGGGAGTPAHPPTVTRNPDGTLNYGGTEGQAERFNRQRQARANATPGGGSHAGR